MPKKLTKCPNFTRFLTEKIVFVRIWGAVAPLPPVSYAYATLARSKVVTVEYFRKRLII